MQVRFLSDALDRLETDAKYDGGYPQAVVRAYRKVIQLIRSATDERTFYQLKSLHFEKLKGAMAGDHSMRLNIQWRLILRLEDGPNGKVAAIVAIDDYH